LKRPGLSIVADTVVNNTDPSFKKNGAFDPEEISMLSTRKTQTGS
jgi:hypothetical protein